MTITVNLKLNTQTESWKETYFTRYTDKPITKYKVSSHSLGNIHDRINNDFISRLRWCKKDGDIINILK